MEIVTRDQWGARGGRGASMGPVSEIVVHHTDGAAVNPTPQDEGAYMRSVESMHLDRGWAGIGYGFVVFPSGRVHEGRGWSQTGAHCPGKNASSVGIAFHLRGMHATPTVAAVDAFRALVADGVARYHLTEPVTISGHRDHRATLCPGDRLYEVLPSLMGTRIPPVGPEELPGARWVAAIKGLVLTLVGRR
jgi:peptidoglycan recognition protein